MALAQIIKKIQKANKKFIQNVFNFNYKMYIYLGVWEIHSDLEWKNQMYKIYRYGVVMMHSLTVLCFLIDAYLVKDDIDKLSFNATNGILVYLTLGKVGCLYKTKNEMESLLRKLEHNFYDKKIGKSPEDLQILYKSNVIISFATQTLYTLLFITTGLRAVADSSLDSRIHVIPISFIKGIDDYFAISYSATLAVITHLFLMFMSHELILCGVLLRFVCHFEIVSKNIGYINDLYENEDSEKSVQTIFQWHETPLLKNQYRYNYDCIPTKPDVLIKLREKQTKELLSNVIQHHQKVVK